MTIEEVFNRSIGEPNTGCWIFDGAFFNDGYAAIKYQGKNWRAHRLSWTLFNGPIPDGKLVCHKCDLPPCWNPQHLFLGDNSDNQQDSIAKGRFKTHTNGNDLKTHCIQGHPFDKENTYVYLENGIHPKRKCRTCQQMRDAVRVY